MKWSDGEDFTAEDIAFSINLRKNNDEINAASLPYGDVAVRTTARSRSTSRPASSSTSDKLYSS